MEKPKFKEPKNRGDGRVVVMGRLSYVHLDQPWSGSDANEKKYCVSLIIDKDDEATLKAIETAIDEARKKGVASKWGGKEPKKLQLPLRDGDEEREDEAYSGAMFVNANSSKPVACLNRLREAIDPADIYSGCYALVSVGFYPYDANGNRGIAAGLNAVMKWSDGERLGGGGDGSKDFDEIDTETEGEEEDW